MMRLYHLEDQLSYTANIVQPVMEDARAFVRLMVRRPSELGSAVPELGSFLTLEVAQSTSRVERLHGYDLLSGLLHG